MAWTWFQPAPLFPSARLARNCRHGQTSVADDGHRHRHGRVVGTDLAGGQGQAVMSLGATGIDRVVIRSWIGAS